MANNISNVNFRIDTGIKNQTDRLFAELGLNITTASNIFIRQTVREGSITFSVMVNTPNSETVAGMLEDEPIAINLFTSFNSEISSE